jgi:hypothetical protein
MRVRQTNTAAKKDQAAGASAYKVLLAVSWHADPGDAYFRFARDTPRAEKLDCSTSKITPFTG